MFNFKSRLLTAAPFPEDEPGYNENYFQEGLCQSCGSQLCPHCGVCTGTEPCAEGCPGPLGEEED